MTGKAILQSILTERDDDISSELNVDPLGVQVIWSLYGQKIFRHRISSISNDVRNFTLNLFHHAVVKALVEDDSVVLGTRTIPEIGAKQGKRSMVFKQACLIYLENLYTYSMVQAEQGNEEVVTGGVLGISKARRQWASSKGNPELIFSHKPQAHVLVRQNSLGVSGRYKTPLVEMQFFDSNYDYSLPVQKPNWDKAHAQLFAAGQPLHIIKTALVAHLKGLLADTHGVPRLKFSDIPQTLKRDLVTAFRSPQAVGAYTRQFWLAVTELDVGAAGALYTVLQREWLPDGQRQPAQETRQVFTQAGALPTLTTAERQQLSHVALLEPLLAELDLLMDIMLSSKTQSLDDVLRKWKQLGRDDATLPGLAKRIAEDQVMQKVASGTAGERLKALLKLASAGRASEQVRQLLDYHEEVMEKRGQSPWLRLTGSKKLRADVRLRAFPPLRRHDVGDWVNPYYLPQFRVLIAGMRGETA